MKTLQYTDSRGRVQPPKTLFELAGEYCRWELQRRLTQTALHLGLQDLGTCLVQAAECLHLEGVEECLRKGADPNSRRGHGEKNAMQWAAESERHREQGVLREITWLLLSYDADPNVPDARGRTAIYSAIIGRGCKEERKLKERLGVVRLLVEQGAKVECRDNDGQTPAHAAAERCLDVLQYFVDELQVNLSGVEDRKGNSVLHVAAPYRYVEEYKETIQFILAKYPELLDRQNNDGMTALHLCIASCSGAIGCEKNAVQLLLDAGADVFAGSEDKSLVHEVVRCRAQGYPGSRCNQLLRSVLKAMEGSPQHRCQHVNSKDRDGFTPLMKACAYEPQRSFVKLLEGNGADDTDNGASLVELLLENGARVVAEEWLSSLGWVRRCPNPEVARKVLQRMEGPLELVDNTDTVIHESILNPNPQVLREVLTFFSSEFPAEFPQWINYRSRIGNTALAWAAAHSKGSAAKVRLLLDFGADVDKPNTKEGNSPLHLAARYGEVEIIRVLVSGGAALSLPNGGKLPCDLWTYFLSDLPPSAPNEDCRAEVTRILTHVVSDTN